MAIASLRFTRPPKLMKKTCLQFDERFCFLLFVDIDFLQNRNIRCPSRPRNIPVFFPVASHAHTHPSHPTHTLHGARAQIHSMCHGITFSTSIHKHKFIDYQLFNTILFSLQNVNFQYLVYRMVCPTPTNPIH